MAAAPRPPSSPRPAALARPSRHLSTSSGARGAQKPGRAAWPGPPRRDVCGNIPFSVAQRKPLPPPTPSTSDDAAAALPSLWPPPLRWLAADAPVVRPATARRPSRLRAGTLPALAGGWPSTCLPLGARLSVSRPPLCTRAAPGARSQPSSVTHRAPRASVGSFLKRNDGGAAPWACKRSCLERVWQGPRAEAAELLTVRLQALWAWVLCVTRGCVPSRREAACGEEGWAHGCPSRPP